MQGRGWGGTNRKREGHIFSFQICSLHQRSKKDQQTSSGEKMKKSTSQSNVCKPKIKRKPLKHVNKKRIHSAGGNSSRSDRYILFSIETWRDRRQWNYSFKSAERKQLPTQNSISSKNFLQKYREIKTFSDKQSLREFSASKFTLQEMLYKMPLVKGN